ncbi:hypothetical protein ACH5RR_016969 [Cinchona calisaya]|uniref:Major facilitator superfamily (MFS) profile domain-containing protein n=1 Tax=Cinchona calisaya TaxID=153742 RepID=A0ABD2ZXF5_9GENT
MAITNRENGQYNARITWFLVLSCAVAAAGGLIFGYDLGISGGVSSMDNFLKKFFPEVSKKLKEDSKTSNYCKFNSLLLTFFTSSLYMAGLVASLCASPITRAFGRKSSILLGGAAFLIGSAIGGAACNVFMLIVGRLLLGVGIGFANQSVPLYLSEMAPPKNRGAFSSAFSFCIGFGVALANLINYAATKIKGGWGWRISLAMAAAPASILTLGAIFLPDTPNSLIQHSKNHEKAKRVLQQVRGVDNVQVELDDLVQASNISRSIKHPFQDIRKRKYRPQFIMSIAIPFCQQVTGIHVITFYAPLLFRTIGFGERASLISAIVVGAAKCGAIFLMSYIVDKNGRKILFILGGILMLVCQLLIGGIMAAKLGDHGHLSNAYAFLVLILVCIYVAGFGLSWGPLGWLVTSEIFSLEIRSAAQSIRVSVDFLFFFLGAQNFLTMLCHFKAGIFFFFAGWLALMTVFVYLLLPETKNLPIERMDTIWREHWFWKRFVLDDEEKLENKAQDI